MPYSNRTVRIIVSAISIPLILFLTYLGGIWFLAFVTAIALISGYELLKLSEQKNASPDYFTSFLLSLILILNFYFVFISFKYLLLIAVLLILAIELFRNKGSAIINIGVLLISLFYVSFFAGSIIGIREYYSYNAFLYDQGGYIIIALFITIWVCDSAAYFLGTAFGKHKLFPRVSPNKSWEGAAAGFIFSIITMMALQSLLTDFITVADAIIIGTIVGIFGQLGDLVESILKRDSGVKDSSSIIPGHGGIMDRFDSLLYCSPMVYLYLSFVINN
ncbi:MAG: phosphatidate cytidylyltransferase [Melioribacteraceae bacterium]|nr:phosphatidate cytidylyltransferase [Melioribacteraceae bacterium]